MVKSFNKSNNQFSFQEPSTSTNFEKGRQDSAAADSAAADPDANQGDTRPGFIIRDGIVVPDPYSENVYEIDLSNAVDQSEQSSGDPRPLTDAGREIAGMLMGMVQPIDPLADITNTVGSPLPIDEKISTLVTSILPAYVGEDHRTFILFLKAYFEFMELKGNPRYEAVKLQQNFDIDETLDSFVKYFMEQYASGFPLTVESGMSERQLIKRINEFYAEKGGTISASLLFRILFGKEADIDFPRERLFKLSEGEQKVISTMYVSNTVSSASLNDVVGGIVIQYPYNASYIPVKSGQPTAVGYIDDIIISRVDGIKQAKMSLANVRGNFLPNRKVDISKGVTALTEMVFDQIVGLTVENKGLNFVAGDDITVKDSSGNLVGSSRIKSVGVSGEIKSIQRLDTSTIFKPYETYTIATDSVGSGATISLITGYGNSPTFIKKISQRSTLSSKSVVQDNKRNQQLSYVILVEEQINRFRDIVKEVIHPAGSKMFSTHLVKRTFTATTFDFNPPQQSRTSDNPRTYLPAIGHFTPYLGSGTFDLRGDTYGSTYIDYYPTGFNGLTMATIGTSATHDPITAGFTIGAMGGPSAGTQNPEAYGVTFSVNAGVTLPGYTVENIDQQIQVTGTDSITAPFWIVYKHPKNALTNTPTAGVTADSIITFPLNVEGFSAGHFVGFTTGISTGDIVVQRSSNRVTAIGVFSGLTSERSPGSKFSSVRATGKTLGMNLSLTVKNGNFTNEPYEDGTRRYLLNTRTGNTYDTLGTGDFAFDEQTGSLTRFGWSDVVIGDFLTKSIY